MGRSIAAQLGPARPRAQPGPGTGTDYAVVLLLAMAWPLLGPVIAVTPAPGPAPGTAGEAAWAATARRWSEGTLSWGAVQRVEGASPPTRSPHTRPPPHPTHPPHPQPSHLTLQGPQEHDNADAAEQAARLEDFDPGSQSCKRQANVVLTDPWNSNVTGQSINQPITQICTAADLAGLVGWDAAVVTAGILPAGCMQASSTVRSLQPAIRVQGLGYPAAR